MGRGKAKPGKGKQQGLKLKGILLYTTVPNDDRNELLWDRLPQPLEINTRFNATLYLDGVQITFVQNAGEHRLLVSYPLAQVQVQRANNKWLPGQEIQYFVLELRLSGTPTCRKESPNNTKNTCDPMTFPLATIKDQWADVRLMMPEVESIEGWSLSYFLALLAGQPEYQRNDLETAYIQRQLTAIAAERDAQAKRLSDAHDIIIKTSVWKDTKILLEIFPSVSQDAPDSVDFSSVLVAGALIRVRNDGAFSGENSLRHQKPLYCKEGEWAATIIEGWGDTSAPKAVLEHVIWPKEFRFWDGRVENHCSIHFDKSDATAVRSQLATERLDCELEARTERDFEQALLAHPTFTRCSQLPTREIFLDQAPLTPVPLVPDHVMDWSEEELQLTEAQRLGIQNVYDYPFSAVQGPPGSGKTAFITALVRNLMLNTEKDILLIAPKHENVDDLLVRVMNTLLDLGFPASIVRIFSHTQTQAKLMLQGEEHVPQPQEAYHLHSICQVAARKENDWEPLEIGLMGDFLNGLEEIKKTGNLVVKSNAIRFQQQRDEVVSAVLQRRRLWLCTTVATRIPFLAASNHVSRQWVVIVDEAASCKDPEIMMPLMTFDPVRVCLVGDPDQLGPTLFTPEGRAAWSNSLLGRQLKSGCPQVLLDINFRTHDQAGLHTTDLFYGGRLTYAIPTLPFSPYLARYMSNLPLTLRNAASNEVALTNWTHFIDVANSSESPGLGWSTQNLPESQAISALVKDVMLKGVRADSIGVIVGFRSQVELLRQIAEREGWASTDTGEVMVRTVDRSQGKERPVIIFGCTKTFGGAGWLSSQRRVNVFSSRHMMAFYMVGNWEMMNSFQRTSGRSHLQRLLDYMKATHPGWLVRGGPTPYRHTGPQCEVLQPGLLGLSNTSVVRAPAPIEEGSETDTTSSGGVVL